MEEKEELTLLGDGRGYSDAVSIALEGLGCRLAPQELGTVLSLTKVYSMRAGFVLFDEGSPASYMGILLKGQVAVYKHTQQDEVRNLSQLGPGKTFGEMALIDGEPRSAELRAISDSEFIMLSRDSFQKLCAAHPVIGLKLVLPLARALSQRLRRVSGLLVDYL